MNVQCSDPNFLRLSVPEVWDLHVDGTILTQETKMLGPECGIIDMSGEMTPSRLYMPQNALWPGCDSHPLSRFLPCVHDLIRSELPTHLAPQARGRPADGGSRSP